MTDAEFWEQEFREVEAINAKHLGVNIADLREDDAAWCPECDGDLYLPRGSSMWEQPTAYCLKCRTMWETEADEGYNSDTGEEIYFFRAVKKLPTLLPVTPPPPGSGCWTFNDAEVSTPDPPNGD